MGERAKQKRKEESYKDQPLQKRRDIMISYIKKNRDKNEMVYTNEEGAIDKMKGEREKLKRKEESYKETNLYKEEKRI